jgi:hypothetical protein
MTVILVMDERASCFTDSRGEPMAQQRNRARQKDGVVGQ